MNLWMKIDARLSCFTIFTIHDVLSSNFLQIYNCLFFMTIITLFIKRLFHIKFINKMLTKYNTLILVWYNVYIIRPKNSIELKIINARARRYLNLVSIARFLIQFLKQQWWRRRQTTRLCSKSLYSTFPVYSEITQHFVGKHKRETEYTHGSF